MAPTTPTSPGASWRLSLAVSSCTHFLAGASAVPGWASSSTLHKVCTFLSWSLGSYWVWHRREGRELVVMSSPCDYTLPEAIPTLDCRLHRPDRNVILRNRWPIRTVALYGHLCNRVPIYGHVGGLALY